MSVRMFVLSALTAAAAFPAGLSAQERQPVPRARVHIDDDGPQVIRDRIRAITQRRARLGVTVQLRASEGDSLGATLLAVTPGGPAAKGGLRSGDIITQIDGETLISSDGMKVGKDESMPGLRLVEIAARLKPNTTVKVAYRRDRSVGVVSFVTGDEPLVVMEGFGSGGDFGGRVQLRRVPGDMEGARFEMGPGGNGFAFAFGGPLMELELAPLNADLGAYFGTTEGVLVINVPKESALGLKAGDVILSVDGRRATGPNGFLRILRSYEPGDSFKLEIMRNKARTTVTGKLEERRERDQ